MGNKLPKEQQQKQDATNRNLATAPKPIPPTNKAPTNAASKSKASGDNLAAQSDSQPTGGATPPPVPASTTVGDYSKFNNKLSVADFDLLKVLGKGSFGKVMLVKKKDDSSGKLYAMKTLRKATLVQRNQSNEKLYMVLDYMAGGELFFWLKKDKKFSETRVRLYVAEITLGLEALHNVNIVYRDLKPENILLDAAGHVRLTDFGLAKGNILGPGAEGGTKTFCGTPEYLAPEILENKGHGKAVDWWALGTLMYEMLTGLPPFYDTNVQRMYHKILHEPLRFPKGEGRQVGEDAKDLLRGLLERQIGSRTGSRGADELKTSRFIAALDINQVMIRGYEAEFKPPIATSETDVRNFDAEFTKERAADSYINSGHISDTMKEKSKFEGFTYQGDNKMK